MLAYNRLKSKPGNLTPGLTPETLDGLSGDWINKVIAEMRNESFQFNPARRVMIPKANGKLRPLIIASPRDKIVQEVMRMILESIFEPIFTDSSHGFRPNKGCHTALRYVLNNFERSNWLIKGDIKACFDSIDHHLLMSIIGERLSDKRFCNLIWKALRVGYGESLQYINANIIGTPQGSVISPLLCNIYMNRFDQYMNKLKSEFDKGDKPAHNPEYHRIATQLRRARIKGDLVKIKELSSIIYTLDYINTHDPNFLRLSYVRYADDWLIGVKGQHKDCLELLDKINRFLLESLKFTNSSDKTSISHVKTEKMLFLGTNITRSSHRVYSRIKRLTRLNDDLKMVDHITRMKLRLR